MKWMLARSQQVPIICVSVARTPALLLFVSPLGGRARREQDEVQFENPLLCAGRDCHMVFESRLQQQPHLYAFQNKKKSGCWNINESAQLFPFNIVLKKVSGNNTFSVRHHLVLGILSQTAPEPEIVVSVSSAKPAEASAERPKWDLNKQFVEIIATNFLEMFLRVQSLWTFLAWIVLLSFNAPFGQAGCIVWAVDFRWLRGPPAGWRVRASGKVERNWYRYGPLFYVSTGELLPISKSEGFKFWPTWRESTRLGSVTGLLERLNSSQSFGLAKSGGLVLWPVRLPGLVGWSAGHLNCLHWPIFCFFWICFG